MYSEKTYKNYIFWVQVKRIFLIILLSIIGAALGVLIGKILESTVKVTSFNNIIIVISTLIFFFIALLLTVGTGKQVQDGYWKIAVLRKLTVIQKDLELNNELLKKADKSIKGNLAPITNIVKENEEKDDSNSKKTAEKATTTTQKNATPKKKKTKTLKTPEVVAK